MPRPIVMPDAPSVVSPGAVLLSTVATLALFMGAMVAPTGHGDIVKERGLTREVVYFLPLLPARAKVEPTGVQWVADRVPGAGPSLLAGAGSFLAGGGEEGSGPGRHGRTAKRTDGTSPLPVPDSEAVGGQVYVASQLDQRVERDPGSAAPTYPPYLESQRIEGAVVVSYIVDSTGRADSASLRVKQSTHPAFAEAVRAALPGMRFRPAELSGHRVRQLVLQEFRFVIVPAPDSAVRTVHHSRTASMAKPTAGR
jgi:TonB family protein